MTPMITLKEPADTLFPVCYHCTYVTVGDTI